MNDADGSQERRLTDVSTLGCRRKEYTREWSYDWSPDGKRIAFTGKGQQDIYIINVESGQLTNVTNNHPVKNRVIAWWPEKDKILFESDRLGGENEIRDLLTLYIMDGDGTNIQRVVDFAPIPVPPGGTKPNEYYLRGWVPTTTLQLVLSNVYEQHMYVLDVACTLENSPEAEVTPEECYRKFYKPLFEFDEGATLISADEIYWSSGDPKLTLRLTDFLGNIPRDEIIVINYDGTGATNLTGCSAHDIDPAWSP
jgi:Tol biopolymer transport system component